MSLKRITAFDIKSFKDSVALANGRTANGYIVMAQGADLFGGDAVWLQSRDRYYLTGHFPPLSSNRLLTYWDPALLSPAPPGSLVGANLTLSTGRTYIPAQYNPATLAQRLYTACGFGGSQDVQEVNVDTLVVTPGSAFTGPNGDFLMFGSPSLDFNVEGNWQNVQHQVWIFDGLTDGIPGETVATGSNIYPDGLYLCPSSDGHVSGNRYQNGWAWVDLRTRIVVGRLGGIPNPTAFPAIAEASPGSLQDQSEAPIGGDEFVWGVHGYESDSDASFAQPKGEIMFASRYIPQIGPSNPSPGETMSGYVRLTDFNPFNLASAPGIPARIHGRVTLTSRIIIELNPMFDIAGQSTFDLVNGADPGVIYDPIRRRFVLYGCDIQPVATQEAAGRNGISFWSRQVDPVIVTPPTAIGVPRTADIVDYNTFVGGDLAEPAPALDVGWTLTRASTELEVLTIAGGIGTTSTVVNGPIDDASPTDPSGSLTVLADGVPLAETTDFTVVLATGVITWVTDQQGATLVQASYEHRTVPVLPAHGTLLSNLSRTDANGNARTQVQYPDDDALIGRLDLISSELS